MNTDKIEKIQGEVTIKEIAPDGTVIQEIVQKNLVVDSGLNVLVKGLVGTLQDIEVSHIAIGVSNTAVASSDTALAAQTLKAPATTTSEKSTKIALISALIADVDLPNDTYREVGLFVGNVLFSRLVLTTVFTKNPGSNVLITYEVRF